ncbi:tail fiber protein [Vibrio phage D530]
MSNLSFVEHIGNGTNRQFTISVAGENLGYFRTTDIKVYVNDVEVNFTINPASPHIAVLDTAPADKAVVLIRRVMPVKTAYADFSRGNNFGHRQVNNTVLQQLYLTQELLDGFRPAGYYMKQDLDSGGHQLKNIKDATEDQDAVSKKQWDDHNTLQDGKINDLEQSVTAGNLVYRRVVFTATQGQTEFNPNATFGAILGLYVNGVNQIAGEAYESVGGRIIKTVPLDEGDRVVAIIGQEPKFLEPEQVDFRYVRYPFFAVGGEVTYRLPSDAKQVMSVYINGIHQTLGGAFEFDATTNVLTFAEVLEGGDEVVVYAGNEPVVEGDASNLPVTTIEGGTTKTLSNWVTRVDSTPVSVKEFGAKGDGVTDDTDAINAASATGRDVLFSEGTYLITNVIQTSVSWTFLDGARIVVDKGITNMIRIVPEYTKTILGQGDINIAEFTKYKNQLSNLDAYPNHFMVVDSTDLDFNRNHASGQTYSKNSVTLLGTDGKLVYPLTTTFNTVSRIELSPTNIKRVIMTNLAVELRGNPSVANNMIEVTRNCVDFVNTRYIDNTTNTSQIDLQAFIAMSYAFDVTVDGITCDALSDGRLDFNYTLLTWKTLKLRVNELRSFDGWAQLDGNYTRDVVVTNSTIDRVGGHYSYWDCTFENIKANQSRCIDISGGGRLDVRNLKIDLNPRFLAGNELYAVTIRGDYAAEWDGDVLVDGVTIDARSIRSELTKETLFNVFSSFCDSSSTGFDYGRSTTNAKSLTVRNVRFHCNPQVFNRWVVRACAAGYVGAPKSDAQYPERITVEDIEIVTKSTLHYHQIRALDWFGATKPPTAEQSCSIDIKGVNNNDPRIAGENPSSGITNQVPTLFLSNNARMNLDVTVSDCDWLKVHSDGHASSPTDIDVTSSRVYYIGGDFNNDMTFNGCRFADTRFEGNWKGSINGGWFEEYKKVGGGYGVVGFPNNIEQNISGIANVLLSTNTTIKTNIHDQYTIFEGSVDGSYWKNPVRPKDNPTFRSGEVGGDLSTTTPAYVGEEFLDNKSGFFNWWKATGLSIGNWKQITK